MTSRNCLLNLVFIFNKLSVNKPCYLVTKKHGFSSFLTRKYVESTRYYCSNAKNINLDDNVVRANNASSDAFLNNLSYEDIVGKDEKLLTKLKVILLEIDIMRQDGLEIPSKISLDRWKELVAAPTRSQRIKLLSFLFRTEKKKERDLRKKEERKKKMEVLREENALKREENDHITYGFGGSTIFLRVYDTKIDAFHNNKLVSAMQFGQNLVLDCSYDEHMTHKEASLCAKQMMILFSENRKDDEPFNLHFCNANKETKVIQKLNKLIPTLYDDDFPVNITDKSYLDLFPKENLVYLTPHCREDLASFSHDDIYIIGKCIFFLLISVYKCSAIL